MSEHYYTRAGEPRHTQICGPKAKNPTRATNITDARKQDLLPSVSAYTKMLAAPGLVNWQKRKVAEVCFKAPAIGDENMEEWISNVVRLSEDDAKGAADVGTKVHAALEAELTGHDWHKDEEIELPGGTVVWMHNMVQPALDKVKGLSLLIEDAEKVLVNNAEGYAGTTDLVFSNGVLDYKTKRTKEGEKVVPSETHPMQIAAYIMARFGSLWGRVGYNVYISTTEIGRVEIVKYDEKELIEAWNAFLACATLYRYVTGYDARKIK